MIYVRKGYRYLAQGNGGQRAFVSFCIVAFIFLTFLRFGQMMGLDALSGAGGQFFGFRYYNGYVWNLYCTAWVVIEGVIAVYIFRIYRLINAAAGKGGAHPQEPAFGWGPAVLGVGALVFFAGYHGYAAHLISAANLRPPAVYNLLRFYIKICGGFWILFEWYVAAAGIKSFFLLKRNRNASGHVD